MDTSTSSQRARAGNRSAESSRWRRVRLLLPLVALTLPSGNAAAAVLYDLAADWSDISNPNGVWSLNRGDTLLPLQTAWEAGQPAWAEAPVALPGHVPAWLKVTAAFVPGFDFQVGDIAVHGTCCSSPGPDETNVKWTSDVTGVATVSGATWWGGFAGRASDWFIYLNDTLLTDGTVGDGDPYDRANPFNFTDGSGGASVLTFSVAPGDVVRFATVKNPASSFDHFIGVDLSIAVDAASVPAPGSLTMLALGLVVSGIGRAGRPPRRPAVAGSRELLA